MSLPEPCPYHEGEHMDLGSDHRLVFYSMAGVEGHAGAEIEHLAKGQSHLKAGEPCMGGIRFATAEHPVSQGGWYVHGEPGPHMTVTPSILCSCGDHGFITDGKWVPA